MKRRLDGMICLITGASSGIGAALARALHGRGATLVLAARREGRLAALNRTLGGGHTVVAADVADPEACRRLVEEAYAAHGRLDTLVANAGYGISKLSWQHTPEEVRGMFATNVFGTHDLIHHGVPRMLQQEERDAWRGQLMLVSSAAARRGIPYLGPYAGTKAAQLSLAEALRVELAPERIAVTSVHPASTKSEFGSVAEREGGTSMSGIASRGGQQTSEQVAAAMVRAIERPAKEVWPARRFRWLLAANSLLPGIGDRIMTKMRRELEAANSPDERPAS